MGILLICLVIIPTILLLWFESFRSMRKALVSCPILAGNAPVYDIHFDLTKASIQQHFHFLIEKIISGYVRPR